MPPRADTTEPPCRDIADAIGITRRGLYHYISSKEQLLAELVRDVSENTAHHS